jgi:hypothetical protein
MSALLSDTQRGSSGCLCRRAAGALVSSLVLLLLSGFFTVALKPITFDFH